MEIPSNVERVERFHYKMTVTKHKMSASFDGHLDSEMKKKKKKKERQQKC